MGAGLERARGDGFAEDKRRGRALEGGMASEGSVGGGGEEVSGRRTREPKRREESAGFRATWPCERLSSPRHESGGIGQC